MNFLQPTKNKIKLFFFVILASLVTAVFVMLINRWFARNYFHVGNVIFWRTSMISVAYLRHFIVGYLIIAFHKKKFVLKGEYYSVFKVAVLLAVFSYLHQAVLAYVSQKAPEIFFSTWINLEFFVASLLWYYLLACIIYYFDKK